MACKNQTLINALRSTTHDRRHFLKLGTGAAVLSATHSRQTTAVESSAAAASPEDSKSGTRPLLPSIPKLEDLASDTLVHHFRDLFNPPPAQNEWGFAQSSKSVAGITAISFPPYASGGIPKMKFSPGNIVTCELYLDGRILNSYPEAATVAYTWYPHRVVREASAKGLSFTTQTFMPSKQRAVAESISVKNNTAEKRNVTLGFNLRAVVSATRDEPWLAYSPAEADNRLTEIESQGCLLFEAQHSQAVSVQGVSPRPDRIEHRRLLVNEFVLHPGETKTFHYLNVIGPEKNAELQNYERLQANFENLLKENVEVFQDRIVSALTPGNLEFSGHFPRLETRDPAVWKLYYGGLTSLLQSRRVSPESAIGTTYITLTPRIWPTATFIWDISLTSLSLAMLDPQMLKIHMEAWLAQDMHNHLATEYLTGKAVWSWYAVNDMAILRCVDNYLRVTGDFEWLDKKIEGKSVIDRLLGHSLYWKELDKHGHGLADYGNLDNLLEVVSTWVHEVPAMNAGNVYGMRFVASLLDRRGNKSRAAQLRSEAKELASRINRLLYVKGKGWWKCGQPDGSFNEVRHCYDLLTILDTMLTDLSDQQKKEMKQFFWDELHTPLWMHALSPGDVDCSWNARADHSWLGAYTAWPAMTAKGLYKIESSARVSEWVKGFAKASNQGPFGQAHIVETVFPPENGGAYKCPRDQPYGNDWSEVSGGSYADLVIDTVFGADLTHFDGVQVASHLKDFDAESKLLNVPYQGKSYTVSKQGAQQD